MASIIAHKGKWRAHIRRVGAPSESKIFLRKADAERWARSIESKIDRGEHSARGLKVTLQELLDAYTNSLLAEVSESKRRVLDKVGKEIGDRRLSELNVNEFINFAKRRRRGGAGPATVLSDLSYLSTALRHAGSLVNAKASAIAAHAELEEARATLLHAGVVAHGNERNRRPTEEELRKLHGYWIGQRNRLRRRKAMWDLTCFAIATTMRLGEIVGLRWEDFDDKARTILVRNRKHPRKKMGNDQIVPLLTGPAVVMGEVIDPITIMLRQPTAEVNGSGECRFGRIFPYGSNVISRTFGRSTETCKIIDLNFHDLRHDAISRMFEYGYQIQEVAICSGHRDWRHLKRYTNIKPETLHR